MLAKSSPLAAQATVHQKFTLLLWLAICSLQHMCNIQCSAPLSTYSSSSCYLYGVYYLPDALALDIWLFIMSFEQKQLDNVEKSFARAVVEVHISCAPV